MSKGLGLSYATPPIASSPLIPRSSEEKENRPPVEVIDLTGDSDNEEEILAPAEDSGQLIPIEEGENVMPIPVPPPASERLPYTTSTGQRCVRSSGPIRSSPFPNAFPQEVRRLRHQPYQGTQLPRGSRPLRSLARIRSSHDSMDSYSSESNASVGISSSRATSPPGP